MSEQRGLFFVIEGIDGSGISTQSRLLWHWLREQGRRCHLPKEPSAGPVGTLIRLALARRLGWRDDGQFSEIDERTLALLFAADRADHLGAEIRPLLARGVDIVCDRYVLSSCAYHSLALDVEWIEAINSAFPAPDLTLFLDVPAEVCLERLTQSRVNFERRESLDELRRIRENFIANIKRRVARGERIEIIPAQNRPIAEVAEMVRRAVRPLVGSAAP